MFTALVVHGSLLPARRSTPSPQPKRKNPVAKSVEPPRRSRESHDAANLIAVDGDAANLIAVDGDATAFTAKTTAKNTPPPSQPGGAKRVKPNTPAGTARTLTSDNPVALNDAANKNAETKCVCGAHLNCGIHRRVFPMTRDGLACMTPGAVAKRVEQDDLRRCREDGFTTKDKAVESGLQGTFPIRSAVYIEPDLLPQYAPEGQEGEPRSKTMMGLGKFGYMWETKLGVLHEDGPTTQMFITNNALADSGLLFHHTGPNTGKRIVPSAELAKSDMNLFERLLDIPLAVTIRIKKVSCEGVKKEGRGGCSSSGGAGRGKAMKTKRNEKCPCGSGKKYKMCCMGAIVTELYTSKR